MGFGDLPPIEKTQAYLDAAFKKARERSREYNLSEKEKNPLSREKTLAILKIATVKDYLSSRFNTIIDKYPNFDNLTEFYTQLLKLTLDFKQLKKSLGTIAWSVGKIHELSTDSIRRIKRCMDPSVVGEYLRKYYGRIGSVLRQAEKQMIHLHMMRQVMRDYPSIKEDEFTVCIAGFPNVGKSTLLSKITPAKPEIKAYAFTTKKLNQGYANRAGRKIQFIDTPGTLNRLEKMNPVEKVAYLAMKYVGKYVVFIFDITEESYSLKDQTKLFEAVKRYGKPIVCYLSKTDLLSDEQIEGFTRLFEKKKVELMTDKDDLMSYLWEKLG